MAQDMLADWVMSSLDSLASKAPFGEGRVQLGFACDCLFLPKEMVISLFEKVKALGIKLITLHYGRGVVLGTSLPPPSCHLSNKVPGYNSLPAILHSYGLLDSSILFAHFTNPTLDDAKLLVETNSHLSSTPSTELQMGMGHPVALNSDIQSHSSLGIDCHSNNSASIVSEMRLLLQSSRNIYSTPFIEAGKVNKTVNKTVEDVFNLGTIGGARAVRMEDRIGSLAVGKLADLLVFDALSPGMVGAAQHDPVAAIVLHSSPADIEIVFVDGVARKKESVLLGVDTGAGKEIWGDGEVTGEVAWKVVAKELVKRREELQKKIEKLDMDGALDGMVKAFYVDTSNIVESI